MRDVGLLCILTHSWRNALGDEAAFVFLSEVSNYPVSWQRICAADAAPSKSVGSQGGWGGVQPTRKVRFLQLQAASPEHA